MVPSKSGWKDHLPDTWVDINCVDPSKLQLNTDEFIWASFDKLESAVSVENKSKFNLLEKKIGLAYDPDSVLADRPLRRVCKPVSMSMSYWAHIFGINGILNKELMLLLNKDGRPWTEYQHYQALWNWPKGTTSGVQKCYTEKRRLSSKEHFKCGASEALDLAPVVGQMVLDLGMAEKGMSKEVNSMFALLRIIDMLSSHTKNDQTKELHEAICSHMASFDEAYPRHAGQDESADSRDLVHKCHQQFHLPEQLQTRPKLWATFVHERRNRLIE